MYQAIGFKSRKLYLESGCRTDLMRRLSEEYPTTVEGKAVETNPWQDIKRTDVSKIYPEPLEIVRVS